MTDRPRAGKSSPAVYPQPASTSSSMSPLIYQEALRAKEPKLVNVVIDTNVYLSGIIFGGTPGKVLELAKDKKIVVFTSPSILLEVADKLNKKLHWNEEKVETTLKAISKITEVIEPNIKLKAVKEDSSDNKVLECAVTANANYVVTGDKHLLSLKEFEGTRIVPPSEFLRAIKSFK